MSAARECAWHGGRRPREHGGQAPCGRTESARRPIDTGLETNWLAFPLGTRSLAYIVAETDTLIRRESTQWSETQTCFNAKERGAETQIIMWWDAELAPHGRRRRQQLHFLNSVLRLVGQSDFLRVFRFFNPELADWVIPLAQRTEKQGNYNLSQLEFKNIAEKIENRENKRRKPKFARKCWKMSGWAGIGWKDLEERGDVSKRQFLRKNSMTHC